MPHEVAKISGEYAILLHNDPAWHRLVDPVDLTGVTAVEAVEKIGAHKSVMSVLPAIADVPGFGTYEVPDVYNLIRHPIEDGDKPVYFGTVKKNYGLMQNTQVAQVVDMLIDGTKGAWSLETVGLLREGETIFFCLKGENFEVAGDEYGMYFGVTDQRSGKNAFDLAVTPVRMVCANTVSFGLSNAKVRITLRHHADILEEASWRMQVIADAVNAGDKLINALRRLEKIQIDEKRMHYILDKLFPAPEKPATIDLLGSNNERLVNRAQTAQYQYTWRTERAQETQQIVGNNFKLYSDTYGSNGYAMMQSVTTWIDHQSGKDTDNGKRVMATRSLGNEMQKLRTEAYNLIMATR